MIAWLARSVAESDCGRRVQEWFIAHRVRLLTYARRMLGDAGAAEDVVQDVFVRLLEDGDTAAGVLNERTWLFRAVHNLVIDRKRRAACRDAHARNAAEEPALTAPSAGEIVDRAQTRETVLREIRNLPGHKADVVHLRLIEGMSYAEIGEVLGLTTQNVGYILHHGVRELGGRMRELGLA